MTDEELKAALDQIIADAAAIPESMGDPESHQVVVSVALVRAMRERLT